MFIFRQRIWGIEIARYLKQIKQTAIVACPIRGKTGGLKGLCQGKQSYRTKHIFQSAKHGTEEVEMAMFKGFTNCTKKGKRMRKAKWLAYMLIGADEKLSAKTVKKRYRKRFGIESSYRCAKKSERMDDEWQCGISVCVDWNEFFVDQHLARITK